MALLRSVAVMALLILLAWVAWAEATTNYQVVAFFQNTPPPVEISADSQSWAMFNSLGQYLLNCQFIKPGTMGRERELGEGKDGNLPKASLLRGGHEQRDLQMTSCPSSCSSSGSTKCKSLGCAFCGKCRRGRELPFSFFGSGSTTSTSTNTNATASNFTGSVSQALEVENTFDKLLEPYCTAFPGCKIWTKVYRLYSNGTAIPITG